MEQTRTTSVEGKLQPRGHDRRRRPRLFSRYTIFGGRRRMARRHGERSGAIVDSHGTLMFGLVLAIALMNILDAFYTVLFLSHGGTELNPMVDWVLQNGGIWPFVALKSLGIGLCVAFLTLTKNFAASRLGLGTVLIGYSVLMAWHVHLLGELPI